MKMLDHRKPDGIHQTRSNLSGWRGSPRQISSRGIYAGGEA